MRVQSSLIPEPPLNLVALLGCGLLFGLLALACVAASWAWVVAISIGCVLALCFFRKPVWGLCALIGAVLVLGEQPFFLFTADWSTTADQISLLLPPFLLILLGRPLLERIARLRTGFPPSGIRRVVLLFLPWPLLTLFWASNIRHSSVQAANYVIAVGVFLAVLMVVDDESKHRTVMRFVVISGIAVTALAFTIWYLDPFYIYFLRTPTVKLQMFCAGGAHRMTAMGWSQNDFALTLLFFIAIVTAFFVMQKRLAVRVLLIGVFLFMLCALLLTMTRSALLGFILMIHFLIFALEPLRRHWLRYLTAFYLSFITIFELSLILVGETKEPRALNADLMANGIGVRLGFWDFGFANFFHTFGLGMGIGEFNYALRPCPHAHNIFFDFLFEFGIPGGVFAVFLAIYIGRQFLPAIRNQGGYLGVMRLCILGGLLGAAVQATMDFSHSATHIWLFLALAAATFQLAGREPQFSGGK